MPASMLPPNSTSFERAVSGAGAWPDTLPVWRMWNPWTCPVAALPALAWALSVEDWTDVWPEHVKRQVIAASLPVHARKGTVASVCEALRAAGLINAGLGYTARIAEGHTALMRDGSATYDGSRTRGEETEWAVYSVTLNRPITIAQGAQVRRILLNTVPARCTLRTLNFVAVSWLRDGSASRNGTISYGAA